MHKLAREGASSTLVRSHPVPAFSRDGRLDCLARSSNTVLYRARRACVLAKSMEAAAEGVPDGI